jgi:pyrroloquinoline quinone (PQQ) biosynthesis protein C
MGFYETLAAETAPIRAAFPEAPMVKKILTQGLNRAQYTAFLGHLYHVVWHFCPTMAAAASRCGDDLKAVRYALYHDVAEEQGHEAWVLEDVAAVGGDPEKVRAMMPAPPIQAMIGYNYYMVERVSPCAVFGMLYTLETVSAGLGGVAAKAIARAAELTPPQGFRFLGSHASLDVDHIDKMKGVLDTITDPRHQQAVLAATKVNFHLFPQLLAYC